MKIYKKYFLGMLTAIGIQFFVGVTFTSAASFDSVCERNDKKIEQILMQAGNRYYALDDQITIEIVKLGVKLKEPCSAFSKKSARDVERGKKDIIEICDVTCNKWSGWDKGSNEEISTQKFYELFKREVEKALIDPNYSAELGNVRGSTSNPKSGLSKNTDYKLSNCENLQQNIELAQKKFNQQQEKSNNQSVTPGLQMIMWSSQQMIKTLQSDSCEKNAINKDLIDQYQITFNQAQTTCNQINSQNECVPKIPALIFEEYSTQKFETYKQNQNGEPKANYQEIRSYTSQNLNAYDNKYQGRGKKHNPDAEASRCLKFIPERKQIFNECDYNVEALFCAINPDPNSTTHAFEMAPYFNCDTNSIGMWPVSSKSPLMGRFTAESAALFACKKPSIPGAKFNRDSKSFSGRCSEY